MTTKARKPARTGAPTKASVPFSSGAKKRFTASPVTKKNVLNKAAVGKKAIAGKAAAKRATYILSAPKGARTLTHREIKQAVEKVFEEHYDQNVFINCPFDGDYQPIFNALIFATFECGLRPRCALEIHDAGEARI
jgi:hypothetical protein